MLTAITGINWGDEGKGRIAGATRDGFEKAWGFEAE